jgi:hypothetical protein
VFATARGEPLTRSRFGEAWRDAVEGAGLPAGTTYHDLRHFYASLLIDHGESVKVVQRRLGHASATETLDTYSHLWPDSEDRSRDAVDSVLGRSCEPSVSQAAPPIAFPQVSVRGRMGGEPAGKPDSVPAPEARGATIYLGPVLPPASCGLPGARRAACERACLALLRTGFAGPPASPPAPVRSYRTLSPSPRSLRPGPKGSRPRAVRRSALCGTFRASPRLGVTQRPALRSPDFPQRCAAPPRSPGRLPAPGYRRWWRQPVGTRMRPHCSHFASPRFARSCASSNSTAVSWRRQPWQVRPTSSATASPSLRSRSSS